MRTIAGRYRLTSPIARGGMGVVWQGSDLRLNRPVAVKLIHEDDLAAKNEATRRFYREARITARLRHPGVPAVYDVEPSLPLLGLIGENFADDPVHMYAAVIRHVGT